MNLFPRFLRFTAVSILATACEAPTTPPVIDIDFNQTDEGRIEVLPRLDDPFSVEETSALRAGFDWTTTEALPVVDPDGRPALRYAIAFIRSDDERAILDAIGPHEPLPMFASERMRWAGQVGRFGFFGDGDGLFHFVVLPASTYNTVRELALEGRPPIEAIILRDVPVAEARNEDGTINYAWLAERGFRMNEDRAAARSATGDGSAARVEPFLVEFFLLILGSRDARDGVDDAFAEINAAGREGENYVHVELRSSDASFPRMIQAWGTNVARGSVAGEAMELRGIEVIAQREVGATRGRTNRFGIATVSVAVGAAVSLCVRASNHAVQVDEGFEATQQCDFRLSDGVTITQAVDEAAVNIIVADPVWNAVAQMTDAYDYSRRVMGHTVSHRATLLIGGYADFFGAFNDDRAFALCGSYTSSLNVLWGGVADLLNHIFGGAIIGALGGQFLVDKIMQHDIIFPRHGEMVGGLFSRGVPTHEYGHFVQCDMLSTLGGDGDFSEAWSDVVFTSLGGGGGPRPETESLFLTEGIAEYFASQVMGGVNYFRTVPASGDFANPMWMLDPTSSGGLEDNVGGGAQQVVTLRELSVPNNNPFDQSVATVTTLLNDGTDGGRRPLPSGVSDHTTLGAFFVIDPAGDFVPTTTFNTYTSDESVTISGRMLPDVFSEMSTMGNTLNRRNFYGALARVARREFSDEAVCNMFALHSPDGRCTTIVDPDDLMDSPIVPSVPIIVSGSVTAPNTGTWSWRDISVAATGYSFEVVDADGTALVPRMPRMYDRTATFSRTSLPFDRRVTFRVATVNGAATSLFAQHTVHSFAEPVLTVTGTPLRGAAHLSWSLVRATSYSVHDVTGGADIVVATTTLNEVTLTGLAGGVPRTYRVVAHNAVGVPTSPSAAVTVTPLAPMIVYVAPFGDDLAPSAGAATAPYRSFGAAVARAVADGADEVIVHEGVYTGPGPVSVPASTLTIRGGFRYAGGTWMAGDGSSVVTINMPGSTTGAVTCATDAFNVGGRPLVAAIQATDGSQLRLVDLEIRVSGGPNDDCYGVVHGTDSTVQLDGVLAYTFGDSSSSCSFGVSATRASRIEVHDSRVFGLHSTDTSFRMDLEAAGILVCDGPSVHLSHSVVAGVEAPALLVSSSAAALVAFAANDAADVFIQRSRLDPVLGDYDWESTGGYLAGMQVTATGRVFVGNSVIRTPHGGSLNRALEIGGTTTESLSALQLYHVTAVVGDDWDVSGTVPSTYRGAAVYLTGEIGDVSLYNNLLLLAGGAANGVNFTGIDRFGTTVDPVNLQVVGNIVSVPFTSPFHLATLMQCAADAEFVSWFDEESLNASRAHECHGGWRGSWLTTANRAFTHPPGGGVRPVVEVEADGYPRRPARVFFGTTPALPLMSEVTSDIADLPRVAPLGAGAWAQRP